MAISSAEYREMIAACWQHPVKLLCGELGTQWHFHLFASGGTQPHLLLSCIA